MALLLGVFTLLWTLWPIMFLALLEGVFCRGGKFSRLGAIALRNLSLAWIADLGMRMALQRAHLPLHSILPDAFFWLVGAALLGTMALRFICGDLDWYGCLRTAEIRSYLLRLSSSEFKQLVADTCRSFGDQVVDGPGNQSIDLIVYAPDHGKQAVQCKRWSGKVGEYIVRDFYGAMQQEGALEGLMLIPGTFTPQAIEWARDKPLRLYDGEDLARILFKFKPGLGDWEFIRRQAGVASTKIDAA